MPSAPSIPAAANAAPFSIPASVVRWVLLASAAVSVGVIGLLDQQTSWEISLFVLYGVPVFVVVWLTNWQAGLATSIVCTVVWWSANKAENPYTTAFGYQLAAVSRFAYFGMVAVGAWFLRAKQDADRARIEALERTQQLEREIVRVSEREQQRIGQDLHDGLCQHLAAIGCAAKSLADDLDGSSSPEAQAAHEIEGLIKGAVIQARDVARGMFPVQMDGAGLAAALEALATTTSRLTSVSVSSSEIGEVQIADPEMAMHLYRIAQEAVGNAVKHAGAAHVFITLSSDENYVRLTVEDDGVGFRWTADMDGMGLRTMAYRARLIDATLEIREREGPGTCVYCEVPFQTQQQSHGQRCGR